MNIFAISDLHMSVANPKPMDIFGISLHSYCMVGGSTFAAIASMTSIACFELSPGAGAP